MDSTNPYSQTGNFVNLLNRQQDTVLLESSNYASFSSQVHVRPEPSSYASFSSQVHVRPEPSNYASFSAQVPVRPEPSNYASSETPNFDQVSPTQRKNRKKWSPTNDLVLISAWLNTSKDPVVSNEQKAGTFWERIAAYYAASPKVAGGVKREALHCKQRWQKMNDFVSKFCGCYEAATRQKSSGQNENDVVKLAHEIFYNDYKKKFNLHHAWEELRSDQKWCELTTSKKAGSAKKRRCDDGADSSASVGDYPSKRPPGVKAAKATIGKRGVVDQESVLKFQTMLSTKERLQKMGILERLMAKKEPLSDSEEALKEQLIAEMLGN